MDPNRWDGVPITYKTNWNSENDEICIKTCILIHDVIEREFNIDIDDTRRKQICTNYLEGLEWTMKYYTTGCPDWRWCYHHNYPPLFCDLIHYVPYFDTEFVETAAPKPVTELVQLCYVLPHQSLKFLPDKLYQRLISGQ
jgi:5'-3' exonuclease